MRPFCPKEFKVVALRDCPLPEEMQLCDTPERAADYWRQHVTQHPAFNPDVECFVALLLNTRRRVKGHALVSTGTLDTILVHPREVFRPAIIAAAAAVVIMHNHPSGVMPYAVLCRMPLQTLVALYVFGVRMRHKSDHINTSCGAPQLAGKTTYPVPHCC